MTSVSTTSNPIGGRMAVLVMSCDAYSDAWNPFFLLIFKFWKDLPYRLFLSSESKTYEHRNVINLSIGRKTEWSFRLLESLKQIDEKYVLLLLEDYLPLAPVKTQTIEHYLNVLDESNGACFRVFPAPFPNAPFQGHEGIGVIHKNVDYRVTTQATIWHKDELIKLLVPAENIWQFEFNGTNRSNKVDRPFLSVMPNDSKVVLHKMDLAYNYVFTGIIRGRWTREAVNLCRRENVPLDLTIRKTKPVWDPLFQRLYTKSPLFLKHILDFVYSRLVPSFVPKLENK